MPGGAGRTTFGGDGGKLFVVYLLYYTLPFLGVYIVGGGIGFVGGLLDGAVGAGGVLAMIFSLISGLLILAGVMVTLLLFMNKFFEFYYSNVTFDGQPCKYNGTLGSLFKAMLVNMLLISVTFGIYTPWAMVKFRQWQFENIEVGGQRGRLTFHGDGGTLFGKYLLGMLLIYCTFGIYGPWFANDIFAFLWDNTKLDGRNFQFRKDPGGFFGTYLLNMILIYCTFGIYSPWAMCNIIKWEHEHIS